MIQEAARQEIATIIAAMVAAHTDYPLVVETNNRDPVDQTTQTDPYFKVQIKWLGGEQKDLGPAPMVGQYGQILLAACVKEGSGEKAANVLMDFCAPYFERKALALLQTDMYLPMSDPILLGWYYVTGLVNFKCYRISA